MVFMEVIVRFMASASSVLVGMSVVAIIMMLLLGRKVLYKVGPIVIYAYAMLIGYVMLVNMYVYVLLVRLVMISAFHSAKLEAPFKAVTYNKYLRQLGRLYVLEHPLLVCSYMNCSMPMSQSLIQLLDQPSIWPVDYTEFMYLWDAHYLRSFLECLAQSSIGLHVYVIPPHIWLTRL